MKEFIHKHKVLPIIITALVIALFVRVLVLEGFIVRGDSMSPTIVPGDYVFINKLAYLGSEPERGDVIIVVPRNIKTKVIKRVEAVPGEIVLNDDGTQTLLDRYEYYLLGDNREVSVDSRVLGYFDKWDIKGKAFAAVSFWPLSIKSF